MPGEPHGDLRKALRELRAAVAEATFPLSLEAAEPARALAARVGAQVDDYLLPRLANLDAPALVVVGGPTGAGKSTLVNSLIRAPASAAGVLRPTTRAPVLVCHPSDAPWFRGRVVLGDHARTSTPTDDPNQLRLVTAPALDPGCAFLDTPDIDSVVGRSRAAADQLLAAADVWLFLVTAARYADAVPWEFLRTASERGTAVAVVMGRVPPQAAEEVVDHLDQMLAAHHLGGTPLFVVPETQVDGHGLLPEPEVQPLRNWCDALAADATARADLVRRSLRGSLVALTPSVETLATAVEEQVVVAEVLAEQAGMAYGAARSVVERAIRDGALLRGQVLARWQEFVATGEWLRTPLSVVGRFRDRLTVAVTRPSGGGRALAAALESALVALMRSVSADAAEQTHRAWPAPVGGPSSPAAEPDRRGAPTALELAGDDQIERLVRQWRHDVRGMVQDAADVPGQRAYHPESSAALVMTAMTAPFPPPPSLSPVDREVLAASLDNEWVRDLATRARDDLLDRVGALLDAEAARYLDRLAGSSPRRAVAQRLRRAVAALGRARAAAFDPDALAGPPEAPATGPEAAPEVAPAATQEAG